MKLYKYIAILSLILLVQGCATTYNIATHKEELIMISSEKEEAIGSSLAGQVEEKFKPDPDILVQQRVDEIGQKLAAVCDRQTITYHFAVLTSEEEEDNINAFSLPGGYIFVFKDLVDHVKNDDELACVLAHEMAHIVSKHSVKRMQASLGDAILRLALSRAPTDGATRARANYALNQLMLSYSREDEILADKLAIKYAKLAGYNPEGMVSFLKQLLAIQQKGPIRKYHSYRSHPYLSERISIAREEVYGKMGFTDYINLQDETLPSKKE